MNLQMKQITKCLKLLLRKLKNLEPLGLTRKKKQKNNAQYAKTYRLKQNKKKEESDAIIEEMSEEIKSLKAQVSGSAMLLNAVTEYYQRHGLDGLVTTASYVAKLARREKLSKGVVNPEDM